MTDTTSADPSERVVGSRSTAPAGEPQERGARSTASPPPRNLATLDAMRACAALAVVLFHMRLVLEPLGLTIPGADLGEAGVQVFFVLSGYLITKSIISPRTFSPSGYALTRSFRILPLYYLSLVVVLFLQDAEPLFTGKGLADVASHILLVQTFFPDFRTSINGVLWTLSIEWLFYGLMLLLASQLRRAARRWMVAGSMLILGVAWRVWAWNEYEGSPTDLNFLFKQLPGMADLFAVGIFVAVVLDHERARTWVARPLVRWTGLVAAVVLVIVSLVIGTDYATPFAYYTTGWIYLWWPLLFGVSCAALVLFIQFHESWMGPVLRRTGLAYLGLISYGVYLFHTLLIAAFNRGWKAAAPDLPVWTFIPVTLAAIIVVSSITYFGCERPGMRYGGELRRRRSAGPMRTDRAPSPTREISD